MDVSTGDQLAILGRLSLAGLLGAFMGLERELRGHPAGIRTLSLVTLGACLFTDISRLLGGEDRVAAQVVTGIGFLGAGVIFREGAGVKGITTAATVWAAAAVGMAIGAELYVAGVLGAVLIFGLLWSRPITRGIEQAIRPREQALRQTVEEAVAPEEEETRSDD